MQSKALRTIFPAHTTANSDSQVRFPLVTSLFTQGGAAVPSLASNAANGSDATTQLSTAFDTVSKNLDQLRSVAESQTAAIGANTSAVASNTSEKGAAQALASVSKATGGLLGAFTALPLISSLVSLFGGGSSTPAPLVKYAAPTAAHFNEAANTDTGSIQQNSYDLFGNARTSASGAGEIPDYSSLLANAARASDLGGPASPAANNLANNGPANGSPNAVASSTNITVNVQAMDSRSFLDRSQDIAQAVREAMLNMHSINDVVNDL